MHESLRIALMGNDERVTAETALRISLVTEVVPRADLWDRAHDGSWINGWHSASFSDSDDIGISATYVDIDGSSANGYGTAAGGSGCTMRKPMYEAR